MNLIWGVKSISESVVGKTPGFWSQLSWDFSLKIDPDEP